VTALRTRRPTGSASWPRVLLSGEEGTDAPWLAAEFSADPRLVTTYWLEVVPGSTGDVYGAAPGADFELLDHDGTWADIHDQLDAAWHVARDAARDGMPSALVVNSMSAVWAMLSRLADRRARRRTASALIERGLDPAPAYSSEAEVEIKPDLWTLVDDRHAGLMGRILTWPGPVILIARDKRGPDGRWTLKAQNQLGFDVTAWVRLARGEKPEIVSFLTPERYRLTSTQRRALRARFSLDALIWQWSGCTPDTPVPAVRVLDADQTMPGEEPPVRPVPSQPTTGRRAAAAVTAAVAPPPRDDTARPAAATVATLVDQWLALDARGRVPELFAQTEKAGDVEIDVSGLLSNPEREALGVTNGQPLSLRELATRIGRHVHKTGSALRLTCAAGVA